MAHQAEEMAKGSLKLGGSFVGKTLTPKVDAGVILTS
jgi:hypothetical protein